MPGMERIALAGWFAMSSREILSLCLPDDLNQAQEEIVTASGQSFLATEALRRYLEGEVGQLKDIQQELHEADSGEFAVAAYGKRVAGFRLRS